MASLRDIKQRIRSVKNTSQITKAMEVVSATRMRKSQALAIAGRPFALAALDILKNVSRRTTVEHFLLRPDRPKTSLRGVPLEAGRRSNPEMAMNGIATPTPLARDDETASFRTTQGRTLVLAIVSDKGLAGAFNANVLRMAEKRFSEQGGGAADLAVVGKRGGDYFRARGLEPIRVFSGFGDFISRRETEPLADFLLSGYREGRWDRVLVFYTNFRTTLRQEARMIEVLPIHPERIAETIVGITPEYGRYAAAGREDRPTRFRYEYLFEPSPAEVLDQLLPLLFKIQLHHIVLESNASEHSARMVAMKNASDNAEELIGELAIRYNKARQSGITKELTEITAGKEAVEAS